jgi:hypothetical protein
MRLRVLVERVVRPIVTGMFLPPDAPTGRVRADRMGL